MRAHWYSWCAIALLGLLLSACDNSTTEEKTSPAATAQAIAPEWEAHIADYPKRWVATEAPLFIRFSRFVMVFFETVPLLAFSK